MYDLPLEIGIRLLHTTYHFMMIYFHEKSFFKNVAKLWLKQKIKPLYGQIMMVNAQKYGKVMANRTFSRDIQADSATSKHTNKKRNIKRINLELEYKNEAQ